ncbi:MAG: tetratricopeptide repeat protein [Bacteroidetes bacterium]|nr:tetratricopeptide repeat protein [Bacteroidota bacterium]
MNKQLKIITTFTLLLLALQNCLAQFSAEQQKQMLELKTIIDDKSSDDTTKATAYVNLGELFGVSNRDSMYALSVAAKQIIEKALTKNPSKPITYSLKVSLSSALNNIGYFYKSQGNLTLGLEYYQKSINILEEIDYKIGLGSSYNNIGLLHYTQGNIPLAIEYYHKSLEIREKISDKKGIAAVFNNLASLYKSQNNIPQAIDYYTKCFKICEEINDKKGLAYSYNNMGILHFIQNDFPSAINYYQRSLKLKEEIGDKRGISESYHNMAKVYQSSTSAKEADSLSALAMEYFLKSLAIKEEVNDKVGIATTLSSIGQLELSKGLLKKAKANGKKALTIAKEVGFVIEIQRAASLLYDVALQQENWKEALEMRNLQLQMKDSIISEEAMKVAISQQAKYEYEKQKALDDAENEKQLAIEQEAQAKQKVITYATTGGLGLVIIFLLFVFNRLQVTKRQKIVIELQKLEVEQQKAVVEKAHLLLEEKNSEIIASIHYAKRIQDALMTSQKYMERNIIRLKTSK